MTATAVLFIALPVHIRSEANGSHGHWVERSRKVKAQRESVGWCLKPHKAPALPVTITLTRIAPGSLDAHDNLPRAFKAVADEIAAWLGVKDNDPRLTWRYDQRKGKRGEYAAEAAIESAA